MVEMGSSSCSCRRSRTRGVLLVLLLLACFRNMNCDTSDHTPAAVVAAAKQATHPFPGGPSQQQPPQVQDVPETGIPQVQEVPETGVPSLGPETELPGMGGLNLTGVLRPIQPQPQMQLELGPAPQTFLLPLLKSGPNNQIMQWKHALVLARLLDRIGLLTGIFEHHSDAAQRDMGAGALRMLPLELLFDRSTLQQHLHVQTVAEAKARGWDGTVDAMLVFSSASVHTMDSVPAYIPRMAEALNVSVPDGVKRVTWKKTLCSAKDLQKLRKRVEGMRYLLLHPINYDHAAWGGYTECEGGAHQLPEVQESFRAVHAAVTSSRQFRDFAQRYIGEGLKGERFVAAHVRPYPDLCLEAWANPSVAVSDRKAFKRCKNKGLLRELGPKLQGVMQQHSIERTFVLAHPGIRWRVDSLLAQVQLVPSYLGANASAMQQLQRDLGLDPAPTSPAEAAWGHTSLLLLAEQAVAAKADVFVGSMLSSASWAVVHARMTRPGEQQEIRGVEGKLASLYFFDD